jgi:trans-aconitate methyltransferase
MVSALNVPLDAALIDVGGGASSLAAELIAKGYTDVSVLDLSEVALREAQARTGSTVTLLHEDVLSWKPERRYALWHDRAVLHFFTEEHDRQGYLRALDSAVAPGGFAVLGVFAPAGPQRCSGLRVQRYAADDLVRLLGDRYLTRVERYDIHETPTGVQQPFTWVAFERVR